MKKLSEKEEPIMQILWQMERAFVKDIMERLPAPKPPVTTVSSMVRKLEAEGWIGHEDFGKTYRYYPLISKEEYGRNTFRQVFEAYFGNSPKQLLSFFVEDEQSDPEELLRLLEEIKKKR